ncbi:MAG: DUF4244 domain-containing protein [Acidimicrobiia bacterium]|nr:DUF4244 domain-containing protein [Acidimicrobiia bacterium]
MSLSIIDGAAPSPLRSSTSRVRAAASDHILRRAVAVQSAVAVRVARARSDERGQATAEYALVLLGAAAVALMLIAWAGRTDKIGKLLDGVLDSILSRLT